jgi:hypothetical protein
MRNNGGSRHRTEATRGSITGVPAGVTFHCETGASLQQVHADDGAFAGFLAANITGNLGGLDIECSPRFPITRFVARTGGITNCVEPASKSKPENVE